MEPSAVGINIVSLVVLLMCSALFSCSETSLFSINDIKLRSMKDSNLKNYDVLLKLLKNPDKLLTTILILNNLVNILASSLTTIIAYELIGNAGVGVATGIITFLVLIFGEIVPKSLAIKKSEQIALKVAPIIYLASKILTPIIFILNKLTKFILRTRDGDSKQPKLTQLELKTMVDVSNETGILDDIEKEMIYNVFDFKETQIKDVMVNRLNIVGIDINSTLDEIKNILLNEKFSRYPVYDGDLDNILGILNGKDLLFLDTDKEFNIKEYIRDCTATYEFKNTNELFKEMKRTKSHMKIVLDEYGATVGLVTIEDLIEEILGEIEDEYDTVDDKEIIKINDNEFIVTGATSLTDINDKLSINLQSDEIISIGGYIIDNLGKLPRKNEKITINNISFIVLELNKNTIKKIKILRN